VITVGIGRCGVVMSLLCQKDLKPLAIVVPEAGNASSPENPNATRRQSNRTDTFVQKDARRMALQRTLELFSQRPFA
jgi:hypothetical protein